MEKGGFGKKYGTWILLWIGILFGLYRLRYFVGNETPLGYDPGMYKGIFVEYSKILWNFDFSLLPGWVRHEPLLGTIMAIFGKMGANFDWWLTRGIGIINLLPGVLIFVLLKKENKWMGVIGAWLYWMSIVGYQVFWRGYFKQIIAVNLMLLVLIFIQKNKVLRQSILFLIIILLHKHTALYTGLLLFGSWILERYTNKKIPWKQTIFRGLAGVIGLAMYIPIWHQIMSEAIKATGTIVASQTGGDFIMIAEYIKIQRFVLLFSLVGFFYKIIRKRFGIIDIGYIIGAIRLVLRMVNFNRAIVFFDIFVVILAAYGIWNLYKFVCEKWEIKKFGIFIFAIIGLAVGFNYIVHININAIPLISKEEFSAIKNIKNRTEENAIIINSHKNYTPWIMGWSQRDYINPGMAELDKRNHTEWIKRRENDGSYKCEMLEKSYKNLNRPLYIWLGEQQMSENIANGKCFSLYQQGNSWQLWKILF
ncbi:hypothetical protein P148_SR1C00001G1089 [candidate division SR1 bacterium RAAC1_SR1_1]|nr:hypothetical protein P148_SR1C00001G1089 [candidate division SR1 bacterium RAAC1_SR1_1]